jgi:urease accessory protein
MFDTPAPQPVMQRARGRAHVGLRADVGRGTVVQDLHQSGCSKAMILSDPSGLSDVVMLNTAGGLTGGDRIDLSVTCGPLSRVRVATQTAERVYRSAGAQAHLSVTLRVEDGATLAWLPQETILFDQSAIVRRVEVDLGPDARFLMVEPLVFGRRAMGEDLHDAYLRDSWRIRRNGHLIHAEEFALSRSFADHQGIGCLNGAGAVATLFWSGPDAESPLDALRALSDDTCTVAASHWGGRLLARFMAPDPRLLRQRLLAAMALFTHILGPGPLPRVWTM